MTESHTEWTPHRVTAAVDWDAVTAEATAALSAYVRIDSSHPAGDCTAGSGLAHVLNEDLEQIDSLPLGRCPGPARVVKVSQDVTGSDDGLLAGSRP